jgi:hypothetical protein
MDTIRFLNFLNEFSASTAAKTSNNIGESKLQSSNLATTLSAFESQLKDLMNTVESSSSAKLATTSTAAEFVTGGGDQSTGAKDNTLAATEAMLAMVTEKSPLPQALTTTSSPTNNSAIKDDLKEIIAWRKEQIDPMLHIKVGEIWDRQGITDPFNDPKLVADAQHSQEVALFRKAHMPGFVAQWEGDWRTQLSSARQANEIRRNELADAGKDHGFIIGGTSS